MRRLSSNLKSQNLIQLSKIFYSEKELKIKKNPKIVKEEIKKWLRKEANHQKWLENQTIRDLRRKCFK